MSNRDWMYMRHLPHGGGWNELFLDGVGEFLNFAKSQVQFMDNEKIMCPCAECKNTKFKDVETARLHLFKKGFVDNYYRWISHGEPPFIPTLPTEDQSRSSINELNFFGVGMDLFDNLNPCQRMVFDAAGPSFVPPQWFDVGTSAVGTSAVGTSDDPSIDINNERGGLESTIGLTEEMNIMPHQTTDSVFIDDNPSYLSERFFDVLKAAEDPVYHGCDVTQLSAVSNFLSFKADYNLPQAGYDRLMHDVGILLPRDHNLPTNYYESGKLVADLGLPVKKIHMCAEGCMLFWKEDRNATHCKFCNTPRYKQKMTAKGRSVPRKVLRYLPLIPRLQRLYAMEDTAPHMRWHAEHETEEGFICHPSDAEAWKHFDSTFPDFASEVRNVRLGICSDGFAPFGMSGPQYSSWPVIITPYNLPPSMCMQSAYLFLSTIIPGPKNPKRLIDICLQPLIDELLLLWNQGVITYDASAKENFRMRAVLLWTVNDFPAYGMLSGWSTAGKFACPYCMELTQAFRLEHGRKASWFDCHRCFLPAGHPFRRDRNKFYKGRTETRAPPPYLSSHQIWERVQHMPTVVESPKQYPDGYNSTHKFTKQSIFWTLPYWRHLLLRHNLDVMHIEKNVFDNVFNTVMDVKGKTKDNLNARKDLREYCKRPELEVKDDHRGPKPKAVYNLSREKKTELLNWLNGLRFPDGYASNIGRCVNLDDGRLVGMKSHDCHVFMQRLMPIAFKELLPLGIWGPLVELSLFFQSLCSSTLEKRRIEVLERDAPLILCQLARIFPPSFFDCMEHLIVHLAYEARLAGPVHYRWMYPFERFLFKLKEKLKNSNMKSVEASIVEEYRREETANFTKHYPDPQDPYKRKRLDRNKDGRIDDECPQISIFNHPGYPGGKERILWMNDEKELHVSHTYILLNCPEVDSYVKLFMEEYGADALSTHFLQWFKDYVFKAPQDTIDPLILSLAHGPSRKVLSWPAYYINGYKYETLERGQHKLTMNSGVCVQASIGGTQSDFFGMIEQILGFEFSGLPCKKIVLFKCLWYDNSSRGTNIHAQYRLQEINVRRRYADYEPFILAQQCIQVYYASYPGASRSRANWRAVCKTKPQRRVEEKWIMKKINEEPLQQDGNEVIGEQFVGVTVDQLPANLSLSSGIDEGEYNENSDDNNFEIGNEEEEEDFPSESDTEAEYTNTIHEVEDDDTSD